MDLADVIYDQSPSNRHPGQSESQFRRLHLAVAVKLFCLSQSVRYRQLIARFRIFVLRSVPLPCFNHNKQYLSLPLSLSLDLYQSVSVSFCPSLSVFSSVSPSRALCPLLSLSVLASSPIYPYEASISNPLSHTHQSFTVAARWHSCPQKPFTPVPPKNPSLQSHQKGLHSSPTKNSSIGHLTETPTITTKLSNTKHLSSNCQFS